MRAGLGGTLGIASIIEQDAELAGGGDCVVCGARHVSGDAQPREPHGDGSCTE